jgi:phosphoribosylaminoimidazolecarboxamide formyltransferase/IMP cyclohydrolase
MTSRHQIRRALISVSDKTGLAAFAAALAARGTGLVSTGGTARELRANGLQVTEVAEVTGVAEFLDGRVKTLHPAIHGGLLARRDRPDHLAALAERGIEPIDLVVANLYPFAEVLAAGADAASCLENIDIGGVALIRAAAKNHDWVTLATDPRDYDRLTAAIASGDGDPGAKLRRELAAKGFALTARYDAAIAQWLADGETAFPETLILTGRLAEGLRYGENPHQKAAFYRTAEKRPGIATARQLQGRELSYNNYADAAAAFATAAEFGPPAVAIVKHANPCGVAVAISLRPAWENALACDPLSAFGGVVAVNRPLDRATAEAIAALVVEIVIAPEAEAEAAAILARRPALRLLVTGGMPDPAAAEREFRSLAGGILVQERDRRRAAAEDLDCVTRRAPSAAEIADLLFADTVAKHVKSNAIVFAKDGATVGIGGGQPSRVDAAKIAVGKALDMQRAAGSPEPPTRGAVMASDAFFPFADGLETGIAAGVTAVIQPGGSRRDTEVIAAADRAGIAMVFTGLRHFRH